MMIRWLIIAVLGASCLSCEQKNLTCLDGYWLRVSDSPLGEHESFQIGVRRRDSKLELFTAWFDGGYTYDDVQVRCKAGMCRISDPTRELMKVEFVDENTVVVRSTTNDFPGSLVVEGKIIDSISTLIWRKISQRPAKLRWGLLPLPPSFVLQMILSFCHTAKAPSMLEITLRLDLHNLSRVLCRN